MTSQSQPGRTWVATLAAPLFVLTLAACSTSGASVASRAAALPTAAETGALGGVASPSAASTPQPSASGSSALRVTSSVAAGPLTRAVDWTAQVSGPADIVIDHVDFLLDGKVAWIEHNPPYTFNDDGNVLMPWVLAPGSHELAINAVSSTGVTASTQVTVTTDRPPVPAALLDQKFVRTVPAGGPMPGGDWHLRFGVDGVVIVDDPEGSGANEGFQAAADGTMSLYGPANWVEPVARQGSFCDDAEGAVAMRWEAKGSELTLSSGDHPDPCPDRAFLFAGTWAVSP